MRVVITVENGKTTVDVDDERVATVSAVGDFKSVVATKPAAPIEGCVYCKKRGAPCVRHGGERTGVYTAKKHYERKGQAKLVCIRCGDEYTAKSGVGKYCPECREKVRAKSISEAQKRRHAQNRPQVIENPVKPIPQQRIDEAEEVETVMNNQRAAFNDPWDCNMCRNAGDLCVLHQGITDDGKKPPRW